MSANRAEQAESDAVQKNFSESFRIVGILRGIKSKAQ